MSLGTFRDALVLFVAPRGSSPGRVLPRVVVRSPRPSLPSRLCVLPLLRSPPPPPRSSDFSETYKRGGPPPRTPPATSSSRPRWTTAWSFATPSPRGRVHVRLLRQDPASSVGTIRPVLAAMQRGVVQCFSVSDDSWTCTIDEGPARIAQALWSPAGTEVLIVAAAVASRRGPGGRLVCHLRAPKFPDRASTSPRTVASWPSSSAGRAETRCA